MEARHPAGTLYLVPNVICGYDEPGGAPELQLPAVAISRIAGLRHFVVEAERQAWRLLAKLLPRPELAAVSMRVLNEHTAASELSPLLDPLCAGFDVGVIPEAGIPCVADPGAALVAMAHSRGIRIVPLTGPSSLVLALAASGLEGQRFSFLGYLPQESASRRRELAAIDRGIRADGSTRIFIETPYRNDRLLADCLAVLSPQTMLCVARSITSEDEWIRTDSVEGWRRNPAAPGKRPAVFLAGRSARLSSKQ